MNTRTKAYIFWCILGLAIIGGIFLLANTKRAPGKLDGFAQCLNAKGVKFYGAFWCPHCQNQKQIFNSSASYLPYIECSTPDANSQLQMCNDKHIESYPTWEFADGSRYSGEMSLEDLSKKTGCTLPAK